jgi:nitrite reductase (NO-forming)
MSHNETDSREYQTIDRRKLIGGSAAAITIAGLAVAGSRVFAQTSTPTSGDSTTTPGTPSASPAASPAAGAAFDVHAVDIAFEPKEFTIPADTDVVVTVINDGALQHDFNIDELGIKSDLLNSGETDTVTINAAAGTYEYYCSVTGHREAGMVGTLTVE